MLFWAGLWKKGEILSQRIKKMKEKLFHNKITTGSLIQNPFVKHTKAENSLLK